MKTTPERIKELEVADAEGRVVVVPFSIPRVVFYLNISGFNKPRIDTWPIHRIRIEADKAGRPYIAKMGSAFTTGLKSEEIYLTRAEAEAALERIKADA